jgi:hypothetical protein
LRGRPKLLVNALGIKPVKRKGRPIKNKLIKPKRAIGRPRKDGTIKWQVESDFVEVFFSDNLPDKALAALLAIDD